MTSHSRREFFAGFAGSLTALTGCLSLTPQASSDGNRNDTLAVERSSGECGVVAAEAVEDAIYERLTETPDPTNVYTSLERDEDGERVAVYLQTTIDRDDNVVSTPAVSEERVESVAPTTVTATIQADNGTQSCTYPVTVVSVRAGQD